MHYTLQLRVKFYFSLFRRPGNFKFSRNLPRCQIFYSGVRLCNFSRLFGRRRHLWNLKLFSILVQGKIFLLRRRRQIDKTRRLDHGRLSSHPRPHVGRFRFWLTQQFLQDWMAGKNRRLPNHPRWGKRFRLPQRLAFRLARELDAFGSYKTSLLHTNLV